MTTAYTYGAFNNILTATDPLSHTTTLGWDPLGRLLSCKDSLNHTWTFTGNADGQVASVTSPLGSAYKTSFAYNLGDLTQVTDPLGRSTRSMADAAGRYSMVINPRGEISQSSYDPIWGIKTVSDGNGNAVTTNYNADGFVSSVVDPRGKSTEFTYDLMDRPMQRKDPLGRSETYSAYIWSGIPRSLTDRKSQVSSRTYDSLGRIKTAVFADGHSLAYTWDKGDRLQEVADTVAGVTNKVTRAYDGLDRLTSETVMQGAATLGTVTYTYDNASRLATKSVPGQNIQCYVYDNADRLTSINIGTTCAVATAWTSFTYDNADRRLTVTLHNGVVGTYAYTNADEVTSITYKKGTTTLGVVTYTYDAAGRIATRGGVLFKSVLPAATTATAVYNANSQLTSWNGTAISYDLNGNLINDGTRSFTWDARNRLTAITGLESYVYDAVGRRQSAAEGATTTAVLYDGYDTVQEQSPVGTVTAAIHTGLGTDERFDRYAGGAGSFYLTDLLGSTVALSDLTGTAVQTTYGYDPYGVTTQSGVANSNQYQFTGRQNDGTGLYYHRARYYNPAWGRFISEDPIGLAGGINQYAYVAGNPVSLIDPTGLSSSLGECLLNCSMDWYGVSDWLDAGYDGMRAVQTVGAVPIHKPSVGLKVLGNATRWTNVVSYGGHLSPFNKNIGRQIFGSARLWGILGRVNIWTGSAFLAWDAWNIGTCTYQCTNDPCR